MDESFLKKTILQNGNKSTSFPTGSKVKFHFCTRLCNEENTIIDDSKAKDRPMELIIGKKFKLEAWEAAVQTMAINEVSSFVVHSSLVHSYPFVAKTLRDIDKPSHQKKSHCCGSTLQNEGVGYNDLNELIKEPQDLEFIFELLSVETPEEYVKDTWQMDDSEKLEAVPALKEEGNSFYKDGDFERAAEKYCQAIGMLEQLMIKEKPGDEEWTQLNQMKLPILLNFAQCKLINEEYYQTIEHCTTVIDADHDNVKALFRRAKAHVGAWNPNEALEDFKRVVEIDVSLKKVVDKEIRELEVKRKEKDTEDKAKLLGKMF